MSLFSRKQREPAFKNPIGDLEITGYSVRGGRGNKTVAELMEEFSRDRRVVVRPDCVKMGATYMVHLEFGDSCEAAFYVNALVSDFVAQTRNRPAQAIEIIGLYLAEVMPQSINENKTASELSSEVVKSYVGHYASERQFLLRVVGEQMSNLTYPPRCHNANKFVDELDTEAFLAQFIEIEGHYFYKEPNHD